MELDQLVPANYNNIVAVECETDKAILFRREADQIVQDSLEFFPFILLEKAELLQGANLEFMVYPLAGEATFKYIASFPNLDEHKKAVQHLKKTSPYGALSPFAPFRIISDQIQQAMISKQIRLFRDMKFNQVRRFQFDIETLCSPGYDFSNPNHPDDAIIIIAMSDNTGWEKLISLDSFASEKELLAEFVKTVQERDPDVLEGHNICRFDLPYIETRAKMHKVKLHLGRNGKLIKKRSSRFNAAERTINYTRYDAYGRHVVDTYHLSVFYDIIHRNLESYGLKYIARHFGVAAPERTYIAGDQITNAWHKDRNNLLKYALDDVRETQAISNILSPSYFYQAQLIPLKYQDCVVRGNASCIDAMLLSEYMRQKQSLPRPQAAQQFTGAMTKAFEVGTFKNVWHCDVRSLYPSIIVSNAWVPTKDHLGAFPRLLQALREYRLEAKDQERRSNNQHDRDYYNALQTTFKILINSFYGYLGFSQGTFNDYNLAEKVTATGREVLTKMLIFLQQSGAKVIEMDTDGLYFVPPENCNDKNSLKDQLQAELPQGIEVEFDADYQAMFCYKSKNYALLENSGEISITGAALKSRGLEPFQRNYLEELLTLLLHEKYDQIEPLFDSFKSRLKNCEFPLKSLAKTETLNNSIENYQKKLKGGTGRRSAAYELAAAASREYFRGDQISYYIIGDKKRVSVVDNSKLLVDAPEQRDENVAYYINKLTELHKKFVNLLPEVKQQDMLF